MASVSETDVAVSLLKLLIDAAEGSQHGKLYGVVIGCALLILLAITYAMVCHLMRRPESIAVAEGVAEIFSWLVMRLKNAFQFKPRFQKKIELFVPYADFVTYASLGLMLLPWILLIIFVMAYTSIDHSLSVSQLLIGTLFLAVCLVLMRLILVGATTAWDRIRPL